jgi:hypothetical protein
MTKSVGLLIVILLVGCSAAQAAATKDFDAARAEYHRSSCDESARVTYVVRLARIAHELINEYREGGRRNDELMGAINSELRQHPTPSSVNSRKMTQLLVGKWESPRRLYIFQANGKWGSEDGSISSGWRIERNELVEDDSRATIILIDSDYFIYSRPDGVFFHFRVRD